MPYCRASATSFSKNGRSTHCAVGFDGKLMISMRGFGNDRWIVCSSAARNSASVVIGTWRMSAPAITGP